PGGIVRSRSYEIAGPLAEATLRTLNLDIAFIGVDGISPEAGLTTYDVVEASTNRVMIQQARRVVVVADHSKIGRVTFAQICGLDCVDTFITDT
ncbi:MAG: alkaline phosphatase, partial [Chloroflexota bacterium]